jgi:hypothetical protein
VAKEDLLTVEEVVKMMEFILIGDDGELSKRSCFTYLGEKIVEAQQKKANRGEV